MIPKKFYTSLPVIFLGFSAACLILFSGCGGLFKRYIAATIILLLIFYITSLYIISFVEYFKKKRAINFLPLVITAIFTGLSILAVYFNSEKFKNKIVVEASNGLVYRMIDLTLREGNKVEVSYGAMEEKCTCKGTYQIKGDTLVIENMNQEPKHEITYDRYFMSDDYLIPIEGNVLNPDTLNYLKIKSSR